MLGNLEKIKFQAKLRILKQSHRAENGERDPLGFLKPIMLQNIKELA